MPTLSGARMPIDSNATPLPPLPKGGSQTPSLRSSLAALTVCSHSPSVVPPMFVDRVAIYCRAGDGGHGCVSFRREAHVPRGGPDGGDGGKGGDVIFVCDAQRRDLSSLGRSRHFRGGRGEHGKGKRQHGERGEGRLLAVPPGTRVRGLGGCE